MFLCTSRGTCAASAELLDEAGPDEAGVTEELGGSRFAAAASPVAVTAAISTDPQLIGAASGLYGFMQMANGALCTLAVGFFPASPALSAASVLLAGILLGQYFFLRATRMRSGAGG